MFIFGLLVGIVIGACIGLLAGGLCAAAGNADRQAGRD